MRIILTGAAGFVGQHLLRGLRERGCEVVPVVHKAHGAIPGEIEMEPWLRHQVSIEADVVVHLAAVRHRYGTDAGAYRESNCELVERICAACGASFRRFVYVSSVGVYGFPLSLPVTEATPLAPRTLYSATKLRAERTVTHWATRRGFEFVIVRPTIIYGPGDTNGMLDKMATMIRSGRYRVVGSGDNVLHHTYVDDVVEGIYLAATHAGAKGEDFIVAGPETTTLARLSSLVAENLGVYLPRVHIPMAVARAAATFFDVARYRGWQLSHHEPPINHEKLDVMTLPIAFSSGKIQAALGFRPQVGYREGISRALTHPVIAP